VLETISPQIPYIKERKLMKVEIIAEAGVNHNGDLNIAKKMIEVAAHAGADFVKFQTFKAELLATDEAPKAEYQKSEKLGFESQREMLKKLEISEEMHLELIKHSRELNIEFLSTGFDVGSIEMLMKLGINVIKIPSGEITNYPYLKYAGAQGKRVLLSTGMSNLSEIAEAIDVLVFAGTRSEQITVLHCTTAYPTPFTDVNLSALQTIRNEFSVAVGYSDHTLGIEASVAAVALGARVIEKHFTLDRSLPGPDHKASLEPNELRNLVKSIRNIELAIGDGTKQAMPSETSNLNIARRSIVAANSINVGERFSNENLTTKRPGSGISPMRWNELLEKTAKRSYEADELIDET
jgi:N,N'-diacetyllegionaminate synthase